MYIQSIITHLDMLIPGLLGLLFSIVYKYVRINQRAKTANEKVSFKQYLSDDWGGMILNLLGVFIILVIIPDAINYNPKVGLFLSALFVLAGFGGGNIVATALSKSDKRVMKIIDRKTDVADDKTS